VGRPRLAPCLLHLGRQDLSTRPGRWRGLVTFGFWPWTLPSPQEGQGGCAALSNSPNKWPVTDCCTKAIEQLGSGKLDVRLGGIDELERTPDHRTVLEVLAAFIREHSREQWPPKEPGAETPGRTARPDAQATVLVIGRRIREHGRGVSLARANLQAANLTGANLTGAPWPSGAGAPKGWQQDTGSAA
jgi:hypothetical protein